MKIDELRKYKKILILGYGLEGKSTEAFLRKFCPECEVGIADKSLNESYLDLQDEYDLVIRTPSLRSDLVKGKYTTATNIFFANASCKVIGITGTKGKSTTAKLLNDVLSLANKHIFLAGNIGKPLLDLLVEEALTNESYVVAELSSYQLSDIHYTPNISVILNLDEAHLDFHGSMDAYKEAKLHIIDAAQKNDVLVVNKDIDITELKTNAQIITFDLPINPIHKFHEDTVAAIEKVVDYLDLDKSIIQTAAGSYKALPHRLENVGTFDEITFINDSASTVPAATIYALKALRNVNTLIVGGMMRDHSMDALVDAVVNSEVENVVLLPDIQSELSEQFAKVKPDLITLKANDMDTAVQISFEHTKKGTICLLSPGFASYNMYTGFPQRGDDFVNNVKKYAQKETQEEETTKQTTED